MRVVHLMASPFFGGPERQMLGLAQHMRKDVESVFLSFAERGLAESFLNEVRRHGFAGKALRYNTPHFFACVREVADELRLLRADLLCCSGYKPDLVGWRAGRRAGIPVVSVSHGWTSATWKVRGYEALDRGILRWMDEVVCVSKAQAEKVRRAGVPDGKIAVILNAVGSDAFVEPNADRRAELKSWFNQPPRWIVGSAGRLSPEKGFSVLIEAAALVSTARPEVGFVLFGEGPLRAELEQQILRLGLKGRVVLAGFRNDVRQFLPNLDLAVMSSFTEGLPVVLLEAGAAGVAAVATSVGGMPEVVVDGETGYLVPSGNAQTLAQRIVELLDSESQRHSMGRAARARVEKEFSFNEMAQQYHALFQQVLARSKF